MVEQDPPFGGYYRATWTGVVTEADAEALNLLVLAGTGGAVVDSITIHTRYSLNKTPATVTLSNLEQLFDGSPKSATVTTAPPGLTVNVTYDGSPTPPTNTGSYAVVATIIDPIYAGSASGTLQIANNTQAITFAPIPDQITTATVALSATGGASGNAVTFAVTSGPATLGAGNVLSFTGAGSVSVTASQAGNANYLPATPLTRTFLVTKATATVTLTNLSQTYTGAPRVAGVTTVPADLDVDFLYSGDPAAPIGAGSYPVTATVDDVLYQGSANGTLVVAKAAQTILFPSIGNQLANASVNLLATGGTSVSPVTYAVDFGPVVIGPGNVMTFTGAGPVSITASQAGDLNHLAAPDVTRTFVVSKAPATVTLADLAQTYDGTPKPVGATTVPAGLTVDFTYAGNPVAPTGAGSYAIVGTINDPLYMGTASGTLVIAKASQTLAFGPIANQLADASLNLTATGGGSTSPVVFAVTSGPATLGAGNVLTFSGPGLVTVTASQAGDANFLAAADQVRGFTVTKAPATVTLSGLAQTYDGAPKPVGVVTVPAGLTVDVTYDGAPAIPTEAGSYAVEAIIDEATYEGTATGTLVIAKAAQVIDFPAITDQITTATVNLAATGGASTNPVTFVVTSGPATLGVGNALTFSGAGLVTLTASQAGNDNYLAAPAVVRTFTVTKAVATVLVTELSQTYDGNAHPVTTSTVPLGLNVVVTYDGVSGAPVGAGSYAVIATIDDPIYQGSSVKALTVAKAAQVIQFAAIGDTLATATLSLTATGGGSTLPVTFAVSSRNASIAGGNQLSFSGAGGVSVTANQAGDANYFPAAEVSRTFTVNKATATVLLTGMSQTYDGTPKTIGATTTPAGLTVNFTYNGSTTAPTEAGSYGVVGTISDALYEGSASGSFTIAKAAQTIIFAPIADQIATATVTLAATGGASGNGVAFAVASGPGTLTGGNSLTFSAAGTVTITASQAGSDNYLPATPVTRPILVNKAPATVTLGDLAQTYDGAAKPVSASTLPAGLAVDFTYAGLTPAPSAAGSYAVIATINDPVYTGTASGTLVIGKATQAITFAPLADQLATATVNLSASGGLSGNAVTFALTAGPGILTGGNVLTFSGAGSVSITASQAEGPNHLAAPDVVRTFLVTKAPATVTLSDLTHTYDGDPHGAVAATLPLGLDVVLTYDADPALPVGAGSYVVSAEIDDPLYTGSALGTLVIAKAPQAILFPVIPDQVVASVVHLAATGGGSVNAVTFALTAGPGVLTGGNVLTFTTAGTVSVTASQAGDANYLAAPDVTRTFEVEFSGFDAWRDAEFPGETDLDIIGFPARPYGQALANGFRYYLGNGVVDPAILTALGEDGADWVYRHQRIEPVRTDVAAVYEWSTDLENWQGDGDTFGGVTVTFDVSVGPPGPGAIAPVELRATPAGASVDRLFVRLKLIFPAHIVP